MPYHPKLGWCLWHTPGEAGTIMQASTGLPVATQPLYPPELDGKGDISRDSVLAWL